MTIEVIGPKENRGVGGRIRSDQHLCALAGGKRWRLGGHRRASGLSVFVDLFANVAHGRFGAREVFFGSQ